MKSVILSIGFSVLAIFSSQAQFKKDGSPDMRFKANKEVYGGSSSIYSSQTNSNVRYQSGYQKSSGTYVDPHYKTNSNNTNWDNLSTQGNVNQFNGSNGTKARDYSDAANNYGSGKTISTGPAGGQYYINDKGNKTYVPKRW